MRSRSLLLSGFIAVLSAVPLSAVTPLWTSSGLGICVSNGDQHTIDIAPDGAGGAILVWQFNGDLYAGRVTADGSRPWGIEGVPVTTASGADVNAVVMSDGAGGAFVVWEGSQPYSVGVDVYGQRLDADGNRLWSPADGKHLLHGAGNQTDLVIAPDGTGGAFLMWMDDYEANILYTVRIDENGSSEWSELVPVNLFYIPHWYPRMVADGTGGVIIAFGYSVNDALYAHRIDADGNQVWAPFGVDFAPRTSDYGIAPDGTGGAIAVWGSSGDVVARRIDATGSFPWGSSPVTICGEPSSQFGVRIIPDGLGQWLVAWRDGRNGPGMYDSYMQRIDGSGAGQWVTDGVPIVTGPDVRGYMSMHADGSGGALFSWRDSRDGGGYRAYAQRIDNTGAAMWETNGVDVSPLSNTTMYPRSIPDDAGGLIIAWESERGPTTDIYGQRLNDVISSGVGPAIAPRLAIGPNTPNPFSRTTTLTFSTPNAGSGRLEVFDVRGRRVHERAFEATSGWQSLTLDGAALPGGVYFYRIRVQGYTATKKFVITR
jgi:hypothetical protein